MTDIRITTASSIHEIAPVIWDRFSGMRPFQSHRWYAFGERVMADCRPTYFLVYDGDDLVARAAFWRVANEPLPDLPPALRTLAASLLRRWPLFICRSPLANTTGLLLRDGAGRAEILSVLGEAAIAEAGRKGASVALFDYLDEAELQGWPSAFQPVTVSDPGAILENRWQGLDDFLASGNKKDRQHYKRTLREAQKLGIRVTKHAHAPDVEAALALIRAVDRRHGNMPNPWARGLLENLGWIGGAWLEARIGERLVGGGLVFEDNAAQMITALGLAGDVPYVYFLLLYASLEAAFEKKVRWLRWGSGAYEVKRRLGFTLERNNHAMLAGIGAFPRLVCKLFR
ncbi:MAG: GNAT family N-acetyltransferase [Chloroflexota bacterium]